MVSVTLSVSLCLRQEQPTAVRSPQRLLLLLSAALRRSASSSRCGTSHAVTVGPAASHTAVFTALQIYRKTRTRLCDHLQVDSFRLVFKLLQLGQRGLHSVCDLQQTFIKLI